ncbi:MAG: hypothetical protein L3K18_08795 [Thermoplasmata archaeon]|nr:hypothetical protein [Thermoplasmata archaeon]
MARTAASGAYLSGIGTMLTQTDVCPACGRVHEDRLFRFRAEPSEECPAVFGTFPMMAGFGDAEAGSSEPEFEAPMIDVEVPYAMAPNFTARAPVVTTRRSGLSIPWVMPSEREEFL